MKENRQIFELEEKIYNESKIIYEQYLQRVILALIPKIHKLTRAMM